MIHGQFFGLAGDRDMISVGMRVLAMWPVEVEWWYPGVVCRLAGPEIEIQFDDGDRTIVTSAEITPLAIGVGSRVWGRYQGGKFYYPGQVSQQRGDAIHIDYEDGDKEWTTVSMVRVHEDDLPRRR
jgi:hypothetical protein